MWPSSSHNGKIIAAFCLGSKRLFEVIDNNPVFEFHPTDYVSDPRNISRNDNMVAINSALEVDLTGQVCADSVGPFFFSGIGGQADFIRGAALARNGRPIIAIPSTAKNGEVSRIVPMLTPGAGVVTTRGDVHYVVTEYGVAYLHGKNIRQRVMALINIAHPKFRTWLLDRGSIMAEVAFTVHPDWQGSGVGSFMLQKLAEVARQKGIRGFTAEVLAGNRKMLNVFFRSGFDIHSKLEDGVYSLTFRFDQKGTG